MASTRSPSLAGVVPQRYLPLPSQLQPGKGSSGCAFNSVPASARYASRFASAFFFRASRISIRARCTATSPGLFLASRIRFSNPPIRRVKGPPFFFLADASSTGSLSLNGAVIRLRSPRLAVRSIKKPSVMIRCLLTNQRSRAAALSSFAVDSGAWRSRRHSSLPVILSTQTRAHG